MQASPRHPTTPGWLCTATRAAQSIRATARWRLFSPQPPTLPGLRYAALLCIQLLTSGACPPAPLCLSSSSGRMICHRCDTAGHPPVPAVASAGGSQAPAAPRGSSEPLDTIAWRLPCCWVCSCLVAPTLLPPIHPRQGASPLLAAPRPLPHPAHLHRAAEPPTPALQHQQLQLLPSQHAACSMHGGRGNLVAPWPRVRRAAGACTC
jgi:hypothetical protein